MSDRNDSIEIRTQQAVTAYRQSAKPNLAKLAREFSIPYGRLRCRINGRKPNSIIAAQNKALNPIQIRAMHSWIVSLHKAYTSPTPELIERAANSLLKDRVVSHSWVYRFINSLPPNLQYINPKPAEKSRVDSENFGDLFLWFNSLREVIDQYKFLPNEIFNWDETGYQIGQGQRQKVVAPSTGSINPTGGQNESITGIECISAAGWVMLPWFLPKGNIHMEEWYTEISTLDFRIKPTSNGWIDDETAFEWLCSFHLATIGLVEKGRPRLLLMDNNGSHTTIQFHDFCKQKFIIPFYFLPHTAHLCQPPDGNA
jgi:hypothetical protein